MASMPPRRRGDRMRHSDKPRRILCARRLRAATRRSGRSRKNCASCHGDAPDSRAPKLDALRVQAAESVLQALTAGVMRTQAGTERWFDPLDLRHEPVVGDRQPRKSQRGRGQRRPGVRRRSRSSAVNERSSEERQHVIGQPLEDPVLVPTVVDVERMLDPLPL